jgi:DnaK suppressor protein
VLQERETHSAAPGERYCSVSALVSQYAWSGMSRSEREQYEAILLSKEAELAGGLRNRDGITIEKAADVLDEIQSAGERELAIRNLDRESNLLRKVRNALARIAGETYGTCLHCEAGIKPKRLAAVPWAAYCIQCQEAVDRHEFEITDKVDGPIADAA